MIGEGDSFSGDLPLTRAEMGSLLGRLMPGAPSAPLSFTDTDSIPSWAREGVAKAVAAGIISGLEDSKGAAPVQTLDRGRMKSSQREFAGCFLISRSDYLSGV